jgi:beta-glucosidase
MPALTDRDFPAGFLFGAATSAYQIEGGIAANNWKVWEREAGRVAEPAGDAVDHWERWSQDFDLLHEVLGIKAYRMSVEWARLEPSAGQYDEAAFERYAAMLTRLQQLGITAFVTLYHFTLPEWFPGWTDPAALVIWETFVREAGSRLGPLAPYICTVNEPQVVALVGHLLGSHPPGTQDIAVAAEVNRTLMQAHHVAVRALREVAPTSQVGTCLQLPAVEPATDEPADVATADALRALLVDEHIDDLAAASDPGDYVGVQYYSRIVVGESGVIREAGGPLTQMGWAVYPEGFGIALRRAAQTGLPVIVTENGIATNDDSQRIDFLETHLTVLRDCLRDGVDVRGYLYWSALDNFEWAEGFRPTFGLIAVDRADNMARSPKPSAAAYRRLVESGRISALRA